MLSTHSLAYEYKKGASLAFADLHCETGGRLLLLGASGSGKTTLLHLMAGILAPGNGSVTVDGERFSDFSPPQRDAFRGQHIGMIFQQHFFLKGLSVWENLLAARRFAGLPDHKSYIKELMELLDIAPLARKKASALSQGEQQRFSIARALANEPQVVLADEPTSSLDDANCDKFVQLMQLTATTAGNPAWIIATHDQRLKNHFPQVYQL